MVFVGGFDRLLTGIYGLAPLATVGALFLFFLKAGTFVFGSGLAIVPFLYGGVVERFHWLTERQFLDAVAVAMMKFRKVRGGRRMAVVYLSRCRLRLGVLCRHAGRLRVVLARPWRYTMALCA